MGLDSEVYWRMSPQESHRWMKAKLPKLQIGGLNEDDLKRMSDEINNDKTGRML